MFNLINSLNHARLVLRPVVTQVTMTPVSSPCTH
jgi:hypothetical protein